MNCKKMYGKFFLTVVIWLVLPLYLHAQAATEAGAPSLPQLKLDLPLLDLPYQIGAADAAGHGFFGSYASPSMNQSLAVTVNVWSGFSFGMERLIDTLNESRINKTLQLCIFFGSGMSGFFFIYYLPGGEIWLHEEYHRAVTSRYKIPSYNGIYDFNFGASAISTEYDQDALIEFKLKSPAGFIRLYAAGIEGEYLVIDKLQRNSFFYDQKLILNDGLFWVSTLNSHLYFFMSPWAPWILSMGEEFFGDGDVWAYSLFRPNVPEEVEELSTEEIKFIKQHFYLHFVNYLSPMLFGIKSIAFGGSGLTGNFAMRHLPASFGTALSAHVFLKYRHFNMAFAYHSYLNYEHYFPAIEAELVEYPFYLGNFGMYFSPRFMLGMQPKDQSFRTRNAEFLGLAGLRVDFMLHKHFLPYIDFSAKTNGWVAGNEYLNSNVSARIGLSARF